MSCDRRARQSAQPSGRCRNAAQRRGDPPLDHTEADVWWSDVARSPDGELLAVGQRIADVIGYGAKLSTALARAYRNIRCLHSAGSYYRTDIGQSLWPPGSD